MIVYIESSALAKQYLEEKQGKDVGDLLEKADAMATSMISRIEVSAALAKAVRKDWTTDENAKRALRKFHRQWTDIPVITVSEAIVEQADILAWDYALRGYDAVHLASAIAYQESILQEVFFASFDRGLRNAAQGAGFILWPEIID